ncbi:MAG: NAD+ synthase [Candidatus Levybacteria bacterium]|nr:NAD+ synthase [Candidatus Levybacteria bacterium]
MKHINPRETSEAIVEFIKYIFKKAKFSQAVIALSGGIDSSVSCTLAVRALGKENVFPVLLPYSKLNSQGVTDALKVIDILRIPKKNITQINIQDFVDNIIKADYKMDLIRKGNIMARVRMIFLFDQAKKRKVLVIGTENKTEHLLGYFTRFGDEASDIEPLRNLYKTQIYELAKILNLPESILTKKPTAGLWENQTDEGEFGFTYEQADEVLYYYFDKKMSLPDIVAKGLEKEIVTKVLQFARKNDFKHNLPFILEL